MDDYIFIANVNFSIAAPPAPKLTPQAKAVPLMRIRDLLAEPAFDLPHRGHVDSLDASTGLRGWVASEAWEGALTVTLWFGDTHVSTTVASLPRPDIWTDLNVERPTGFAFDLDELLRCAARTDISPNAPLRVRLGDTAHSLAAAREWTFAQIQVLRAPKIESAHIVGDGTDPLEIELRRLAKLAFRQIGEPANAAAHKHAGMIEFAARLTQRHVLIGGWRRNNLPDCAAVLVISPRIRRAGSLALATAPRSDLPPEAEAFIGVLFADEGLDPADLTDQAKLIYAGRSAEWIAPVPNLRQPTLNHALDESERHFQNTDPVQTRAIRTMVRTTQPWNSKAHRSADMGTKLGIDQVLVVPAFGTIVAGWALHPTGSLVNILAKLGTAHFAADLSTLQVSNRSDLAAPFPMLADRTGMAGFCCVLRGDVPPDSLESWSLRLEFDDDTVVIQDIAPTNTRTFGYPYDLGSLSIVPDWSRAPWRGELLSAVELTAQTKAEHGLQWLSKRSMARAIVCVLPERAAHQGFVLEALRQASPAIAATGTGLLVIVPPSLAPGMWAAWAAGWANPLEPNLALAAARLLPGVSPWHALVPALKGCNVDRFALIGPDCYPTRNGIPLVMERLEAATDQVDFLAAETLRGDEPVLTATPCAVVWTRNGLHEHSKFTHTRLPGWPGLDELSSQRPAVDGIALVRNLASTKPIIPIATNLNMRAGSAV